jgi:hypothetical protein
MAFPCHDLMKVIALARTFSYCEKQAAAVRPNHRRKSSEAPLSADLTIVMTDSDMLGERLNSSSSLRARSGFFIPAPHTLSRSTVKPLLHGVFQTLDSVAEGNWVVIR